MMMQVNGRPVHYVDHGGPEAGLRVVYVHGLGGSLHNWDALAPLLSEHVRAVALDLPGFGRTPALGRSTSVRSNAAVLRQFLRQLGWGKVTLIGNSMGGYLSMLVATEQPTLVQSLILVDPTLPLIGRIEVDPAVRKQFIVSGIPGLGEYVLARRYATVPARQRVNEVLRRCCFDPSRMSEQMVEEMIALEEELTLQRDHAATYLGAARSIVRGLALRRSYWRRLDAIRQPVLLLHGIHDKLIPITSAREAARRNPHWTYVECDAGHIPHMEIPEVVATETLGWLKNLSSHRKDDESGRAPDSGRTSPP